MARFAFARYSECVRYNSATGELLVFNPHVPATPAILTQADPQAIELRELSRIEPAAHAFALAYTLALSTRQWHGRPTDAQRGALIQIAQQLKAEAALPTGLAVLDSALEAADNALLCGENPETALEAFVAEHIRLADRAADRCGRHAINLVDNGDRMLLYGFGGLPVLAFLGALPTMEPPITLFAAGEGAPALVSLAQTAGFNAQPNDQAVEPPTLCVVSAWALTQDGSAVCAKGCGPMVEQARSSGVPCYVLAPSGPLVQAETVAQIPASSGNVDIILPDLISAIVTDRGMYRPAMVRRYLGESDAPPDVIPLM